MRNIRVHVCADSPDRIANDCHCRWYVSRTECVSLVAEGAAVRIPGDKGNVLARFESARSVTRQRFKQLPSARMISARDIERAYVLGQPGEANRIEVFERGPIRG